MGDAWMSYEYSPYNLYVNNLDETIDEQQLKDAFSTYGEIASVKVMTDENLRSRGYGFVCFRSPEDATAAVTNLNNKMLGSKSIYVSKARKKRLQGETTQNTTSPSNSTLGPQVFQPGGASYYGPAIPQARRFYNFNQMPVRNNLRWSARGRPIRPGGQHAARFPGMQQKQMARPGIIPPVCWPHPAAFRAANRAAWMPPGAISNTGIPPGATTRPAFKYPSNMRNPWGSVSFPRNAVPQLGPQMFQRGGASYYGPAIPQARRFYNFNQMPVRNNLRWSARGRQIRPGGQHAATANRAAWMPPGAISNTGIPPGATTRPAFTCPSNMRNPAGSVSLPRNAVPQVPSQAVSTPGQEPLTSSMLASVSAPEQKQMLSERLFPRIQRLFPDEAGKITAKLLEIENSELLHMLKHPESLKSKVEETVAALQAHEAKQNPRTPTRNKESKP